MGGGTSKMTIDSAVTGSFWDRDQRRGPLKRKKSTVGVKKSIRRQFEKKSEEIGMVPTVI